MSVTSNVFRITKYVMDGPVSSLVELPVIETFIVI